MAGMSVDYMHCILLGMCRLLLRLWFQPSHNKETWYIGNRLSDVDKRLCSIKPPSEIQRTPRRIATTVKYWKGVYILVNEDTYLLILLISAHELRAWLLHYSAPVLLGILPDDYYQHHCLLIEGVYLLLKQIVTEEDIMQSASLLRHYCFLFAPLYGEKQSLLLIQQ